MNILLLWNLNYNAWLFNLFRRNQVSIVYLLCDRAKLMNLIFRNDKEKKHYWMKWRSKIYILFTGSRLRKCSVRRRDRERFDGSHAICWPRRIDHFKRFNRFWTLKLVIIVFIFFVRISGPFFCCWLDKKENLENNIQSDSLFSLMNLRNGFLVFVSQKEIIDGACH